MKSIEELYFKELPEEQAKSIINFLSDFNEQFSLWVKSLRDTFQPFVDKLNVDDLQRTVGKMEYIKRCENRDKLYRKRIRKYGKF